MDAQEAKELYKKYPQMLWSDFFSTDNTDLNIEITPRENVQSGVWFEMTWKHETRERRVSAQRFPLLIERFIDQFLKDYEIQKRKYEQFKR